MVPRAGHTAHGKRREPIDPKFRHEAEGVAYKRVVEGAEIADVRARDRNHGGPRVVTAFEGMNPVVLHPALSFLPHPLPSQPSSVPRASTLPPVFLFRFPCPVTVLPTSSAHLPRSLLPAPTRSRPQRFSPPSPALLALLHSPLPLPPLFQSTPSTTGSHSLNRFRWRSSWNVMSSHPEGTPRVGRPGWEWWTK